MEREEEILNKYISGEAAGEDNKLSAAVGSLNSKRSRELSDSVNFLKTTIANQVSNLILNNTTNIGTLSRTIEEQVRNIGISNEKLRESNEKSAEKNQEFTRINIWLTCIVVVTGIIGAVIGFWNIGLTNKLVGESIRANQIDEQPFLSPIKFDNPQRDSFEFVNSGKGAATNYFVLAGKKGEKTQLYLTDESVTGTALGVNVEGKINFTNVKGVDLKQIEKQVPNISKLLSSLTGEDLDWFAIIYGDIYGNSYATLVRGPGAGYFRGLEFFKLSD